jgi:hypothetical protein
MEHRDSIEYILENCGFDFRYGSVSERFSAVSHWGYFYRTLTKDWYDFQGERFGQYPNNISTHLKNKNVSTDNDLSKHKFVLHECEMLQCEPHDFETYFEKYLNLENYINELRDKNLYFVVWYGWEGDNFASTNYPGNLSFGEIINKILKKYDIPRHKIIFLVSNLIVEESLKEKFDDEFFIWGDNWMEIDVFQRVPSHKRKISYTFDEHLKQVESNYEKPFLRVNRTNNFDRDFLLYDIFRRGIDNKFIFEHRQFETQSEVIDYEYNGDSKPVIEKIKERLPLIASREEQNTKNDSPHDWSNEIIPGDIYYRAPLSFISTTFPYQKDVVFFHGSTFEPILNFHPFALNSNKDFLKHLKKSGYVTYDNIFDESYDSIIEDTPRRIKVVDTVENVLKLDKKEILNLILNSKERIEHNRNELIKCKSINNGHIRLAKHLLSNG